MKLGNFAGSTIDLPLLAYYKTSHELSDENILIRTELFTLDSTIYEIMTGSKLYKDLPNHEVSATFFEDYYPNLGSISIFRNTIIRYWRQNYISAEKAFQDVKSEGIFKFFG